MQTQQKKNPNKTMKTYSKTWTTDKKKTRNQPTPIFLSFPYYLKKKKPNSKTIIHKKTNSILISIHIKSTYGGELTLLVNSAGLNCSRLLMSGCTASLALVLAVPATLTAEHWNQAESDGRAWSMCRVERPSTVSILWDIFICRFNYSVSALCWVWCNYGKSSLNKHKLSD